MRVNIFVGIEGTHQLIGDIFENKATVASPKMALFIGPEARSHINDSLESLLNFLFDGEVNEECNIGVSRLGAEGPLLQTILASCPVGTRVFFFKLTDADMSKQYQRGFLMASTNTVVERMTGVSKQDATDSMDTISEASLAMLDSVATKFEAAPEWVNFGESIYFDGPASVDNGMVTRILVK